MMARISKSERQIGLLAAEVARAAMAFEGRWTNLALRRIDPDLADRLNLQARIWHDVLSEEDEDEILGVGRSLVRGYRKAVAVMDAADVPDDAYHFGQSRSGQIVSFGDAAAAHRVAERFPGQSIPHFTFDEAAELLAEMKSVSAVKSIWPGAEIVETRKRGVA